ncbi:hypothetical protein J3R82DRAFT_4094 [Butyriboletus roseoflavus]|nr:hypothetical protein J3R82DRAFT_4094 [Butyriboletus roseoflavus]
MAGANYMGGKRNTARAKSKDIVGRAQRCHFGKQRLASALCVTQTNRVYPNTPTLSSILPEMTLAHARCDANTDLDATSSIKVFSGDRLYSSTLANNTTQRSKPSKVLGALDILDHTSMRAAIDRILQQPDFIGINVPKLKETAYTEHMHTPAAVKRPTKAHFDPEDPDTQQSEIVSKHVSEPPVSYPQIPKHEHINLPETNPNPRYGYEPTANSALLPPDSPRMHDAKSWNTFNDSAYTGARLFTGASPLLCTEGNAPEKPNTFADTIGPLPWSSPFLSGLQSSNQSILGLGASPCAANRFRQSDHLSEEEDDCDDVSLLRSIRQPSRNFFMRDDSVRVDETRSTISSFTDSDEELELGLSRTTYYDDNRTLSLTGNSDFRCSFPSEYGRDSIRVLTSQESTEDNIPSGILVDFLSDPRPWETIGRILKLKPPEPPAVRSVEISFTKDREGVGYVSPERSGTCNARSSDATSSETRIDNKPSDDINVASSGNLPMLEIVELEVPNADGRMTVESPDSTWANDSARPLFDTGPPSTTRGEADPYIHMDTQQEFPPIPVIHCTQNKHTQYSSYLSITVGTTVAEPDVDLTFDGPCLFGESDLEEDE